MAIVCEDYRHFVLYVVTKVLPLHCLAVVAAKKV